jgi:phage shock protein C
MKKIYRSRDDKMIAGICGGIGEMLELDPTLVRLSVVFVAIATAVLPVAATYIVGWIIIPDRPHELPSAEVESNS